LVVGVGGLGGEVRLWVEKGDGGGDLAGAEGWVFPFVFLDMVVRLKEDDEERMLYMRCFRSYL
jgi:hypothetical protein